MTMGFISFIQMLQYFESDTTVLKIIYTDKYVVKNKMKHLILYKTKLTCNNYFCLRCLSVCYLSLMILYFIKWIFINFSSLKCKINRMVPKDTQMLWKIPHECNTISLRTLFQFVHTVIRSCVMSTNGLREDVEN